MIVLPDVNVLVYAFRRESRSHETYRDWLAGIVAGGEELAVEPTSLTGFLRIVTNSRIYADPAPTHVAMTFVDRLRGAARARPLPSTETVWSVFASIAAADSQVRGNLIPDAWLAATAIAHGCRLASADRGFARFANLEFFDPAMV
ncbi:MAG: TA system VapC family ribonuclease toxin [Acidimicrobiales bacterium]